MPLRLPRLRLFSGPNCSLCDIAKAELAKVRQTRQFQLETINIQTPGQESWKRKYVYWIPALHLDDKEIAKGRWDAATVIQALEQWDQAQDVGDGQQSSYYAEWEPFGVYTRNEGLVLGDEHQAPCNDNACFNCGGDHNVALCTEPINSDVVWLSKALHDFYRSSEMDRVKGSEKFTVVEQWRQQRLQWTNYFDPGTIKGELLLDAIGGGQPGWLKNIATHGYPPGWVGVTHPKEKMRAHICGEGKQRETVHEFYIHGDTIETVTLEFSPTVSTTPKPSAVCRWAKYPPSYFLSDILPVYVPSPRPTFSISQKQSWEQDWKLWEQELWERILLHLDDSNSNADRRPQKRLVEYYALFFHCAYAYRHLLAEAAGPAPPPPPSEEPPPLPSSPQQQILVIVDLESDLGFEEDMDLSD